MVKYTLKILRCGHRKIFIVCLNIFQNYAKRLNRIIPSKQLGSLAVLVNIHYLVWYFLKSKRVLGRHLPAQS